MDGSNLSYYDFIWQGTRDKADLVFKVADSLAFDPQFANGQREAIAKADFDLGLWAWAFLWPTMIEAGVIFFPLFFSVLLRSSGLILAHW